MVAHCISRIGHRGSLPQKGGGLTTSAILQTALKISSWTQVQSKSNRIQAQSANCDQLNHAVSEPLHNQRCRHRSRVPATSRNWRRPPCRFHAPGKFARRDRAGPSINPDSRWTACRPSAAPVLFTPAIPLTLMRRSLLTESAPIHSWVDFGLISTRQDAQYRYLV